VVEQTKRAEVLLSRGQTAFSYKVLRDGHNRHDSGNTRRTAEWVSAITSAEARDSVAMMTNMTPNVWTASLLIGTNALWTA